MSTDLLSNTWAVTRVALARLRFLAVFVVAAVVVGYWDDIKNHVDKWTRPPVVPDALATATDIEYYCVMHPNVIRSEPGNCPICGMPLAKRKKGEKVTLPEGVLSRVQLTPHRIALAGVQTSVVEERSLVREIRAVGTLDYDETHVAQLSARVAGRADDLFVKAVGDVVKRGAPVYSLYSPEVYTAQREYLLARKRVLDLPKDASDDLRHDAIEVYNAAMQKLVLWGLTVDELNKLEGDFDKTGQIPTHFTVTSPIQGVVVKKNLYEGGYVQAGDTPYTVADMSNLWLQVRIYEQDVPLVKLGEPVSITVEGLPNRTFQGKITYLAYQLDPTTRTLAARVEVPNPDRHLYPGQFADVMIRVPILPDATPAATAPAQDSPALQRAKAFRQALEPYFKAQQLLAQDKLEGVPEFVQETAGQLAAFKDVSQEVARNIETLTALAATATPDLKAARKNFQSFSAQVIAIGRAVGTPADGPAVKIYHCPMLSEPDWLQVGSPAINPYMGTRMVNCGNDAGNLPKVAGTVATRPVTSGSKLLAVPRSAVIDTGRQKIVFVANPQIEGAFDMRGVTVGPLAGDEYPVLSGLEKGDRVVTVGAFLLDAENRLNATAPEEPGPATNAAPASAPGSAPSSAPGSAPAAHKH